MVPYDQYVFRIGAPSKNGDETSRNDRRTLGEYIIGAVFFHVFKVHGSSYQRTCESNSTFDNTLGTGYAAFDGSSTDMLVRMTLGGRQGGMLGAGSLLMQHCFSPDLHGNVPAM